MTDSSVQARPTSAPPVHQWWWIHDARWYQGVLKRFGQEAANEINAEALRFVARRVAMWYAREHKVTLGELPIEQIAEEFERMFCTMAAEGMSDFTQNVLGPDEWETVVRNNFSLRMLRIAGTLDGYECPCLELRAGWFEGLGLEVADRRTDCLRTGGDACRFRAVVQRPDGGDGAPT